MISNSIRISLRDLKSSFIKGKAFFIDSMVNHLTVFVVIVDKVIFYVFPNTRTKDTSTGQYPFDKSFPFET